jgi:tetratricopeptide (TPR) repeat protein
MKRLSIYIALILCAVVPVQGRVASAQLEELWDNANTLYVNGEYGRVIVAYEEILELGYASSKLYFNLGNAYFKNNEVGRAILNYHRARRLSPLDKDIAYNLEVADALIRDRIDTVPRFFMADFAARLRMSLSSRGWGILSLVFLAVALGCVLVYVYSRRKSLRKAGFFIALAFLVLTVMSIAFAGSQRRSITRSGQAVVMVQAASVRSSPDNAGKDLFEIHEGTVVRVLNSLGDWKEIMISDGNRGWMLGETIEVI